MLVSNRVGLLVVGRSVNRKWVVLGDRIKFGVFLTISVYGRLLVLIVLHSTNGNRRQNR